MRGSDRLDKLTESQTLYITKQVRKLRAEGKDIVGLTLGEPDFDTPMHIRQAAIQAIEEGFTHYPPVAGIPELRQAIAEKFDRDYGVKVTAAQVVVTTGAKQALVNAIMSLVNPGEEAIIVAPFWVSYVEMLKMADARITELHTDIEADYKLSPEALDAALSDQTKMLILNSPNNPTGSMYSKEELAALVAVIEKYPQLLVISDEIYEHIVYEGEAVSLCTFPSIADRVIVINGVSKGFAMTGWRIGYSVSPLWISELCEKFQGQITSGANSVAQKAAAAAISGDMGPTYEMREAFRKRRAFMAAALEAIPGMKSNHPNGAFYFYPDLSAFIGLQAPDGSRMDNIDVLCDYLLNEGLVAVIPGSAFGTDKHIRISYAYAMEELEEGMRRIHQALVALK